MSNPDEAKYVKGMVVELPCFTDNVRLMPRVKRTSMYIVRVRC